jgi:hypothetical protein
MDKRMDNESPWPPPRNRMELPGRSLTQSSSNTGTAERWIPGPAIRLIHERVFVLHLEGATLA